MISNFLVHWPSQNDTLLTTNCTNQKILPVYPSKYAVCLSFLHFQKWEILKRGVYSCVSIKLRRRDGRQTYIYNSGTNDSVFRLADRLGFPYCGKNWGLENIFALKLPEIEQHKSKQFGLAMNKFKPINRMIKGERVQGGEKKQLFLCCLICFCPCNIKHVSVKDFFNLCPSPFKLQKAFFV